jgi:hypothetical protein
LKGLAPNSIADLVQSKLDEEVKRLHNPTSDKTIQLFRDYAGVDVTKHWCWNNSDCNAVRARLNEYIKLRGDVVHRSRAITTGPPKAHPVKRDDLDKAIRFLKNLAQVTERALGASAGG